MPGHNVALRLEPDVIGIDLDLYKQPDARGLLEKILGVALPPTWCSTSRDDASGVFLFRVAPPPDGKRWKHAPVPGCEIVQYGHRYVMVAPSVHPEGRRYYWRDCAYELASRPPELDDLAFLPAAAVDALLEDRPECAAREPIEFDLTGGEPSEKVAGLLQRGIDACAGDQGSRHDNVTKVVMALVRAAEQGEPGVNGALAQVGDAFTRAVAPDRPGSRRLAEQEYADLVNGALKLAAATEAPRPKTDNAPPEEIPVLPDDFWDARESLLRIRNAAHAQQCSAPLFLLAVLARTAAATPYLLQLPAPIGAPRPLSLFVAGVAPSGAGKTSVNDNATRYFPIDVPIVADQLPLGTGEGLVEAFFEWQEVTDDSGKTRSEKVQTKFGAYYFVDEGQVVAELSNRKGATLLATIRSMFSGAQLGNTNADREKRRLVHAGDYTVGLFVLFQPALARALLDDAPAGTPQRFVFGHGSDPTIPDHPTSWPSPIMWDPPRVAARTTMQVDPAILEEIRQGGLARARGSVNVDPLDSHATLLRFKLAGNLAVLERRIGMTADDWRIANTIMRYSDTVRDGVLTAIRLDDQAKDEAATAKAARRHVGVMTAERQHRIVECAKRIHKKVVDEPDRWTRKALRNWMSTWRDVFDDALDHAVEKRWIKLAEEPGQGDDQRRLRPGSERPS